jgi:DNA-binding response OmpR family regulator
MPINIEPKILLITDDPAEESHTVHILAKYHFTNLLIRVRKSSEATRYFSSFDAAPVAGPENSPELIILNMGGEAGGNRTLGIESRMGSLKNVPLIIIASNREEEESIRKLNIPNCACFSRPVGFFKLLEAMQKLGMRWIVLRPS